MAVFTLWVGGERHKMADESRIIIIEASPTATVEIWENKKN